MRILIVSDIESKYIWEHFDKDKFSNIDLIISCGDLNHSYLSFLVTMIKAPLYYVHGNHDRGYVQMPPEGCDSIEDTVKEYKGVRILGLGGSFYYSGKDFQYTEKQMAKRISKLKFQLFKSKGFDILVSHAPAFGVGDGEDLCHRGFKSFLNLMDKYEPKYFFHGHQHLNYSQKSPRIRTYNKTTVINAYGYHIVEY